MTRRVFFALLVPSLAAARGADPFDAIRGLIEENIDPSILEALQAGNWERFLEKVEQELQGDYVLDLATLQDAVKAALPVLEHIPEMRGFASWLRARLDYFDVAVSFRKSLPQPRPAPGQPAPPPINPTPEQERRTWKRQVDGQPVPAGAAGWVPRLKPVFRNAGAPADLVWLAEVESSFDPAARSPEGAVGLYQLMPRTAEELGLKLAPRDERLVPEKNARAAATYLGRLRRQFDDWRLALAAYNAGPGRVSDLLKRRRARSYDAIGPDLPAETQMYVPRFESVLHRREGVTLSGLKSGVA